MSDDKKKKPLAIGQILFYEEDNKERKNLMYLPDIIIGFERNGNVVVLKELGAGRVWKAQRDWDKFKNVTD